MFTSYFGRMNSNKYGHLKGNGISISRSTFGWTGFTFPALYPSAELLQAAQNGLPKEEFVQRYTEETLAPLNPLEVWKDLHRMVPGDGILVCHETTKALLAGEKYCHRSVVARWLETGLKERLGLDIHINELV